MSVQRVMGTETEYAVSQAGTRHYQPVQLSFDVVAAAANADTRHIRWDYRQEDPVNDARGTRLDRAAARPDMLTDSPQLNITNVIAPNGGRIYVDHAHPEYSAPETTDPFQAVAYDHAGDRLMLAAARQAGHNTGRAIELHRNNVDGKGASWGTHENYMMKRSVPFDDVAGLMTAHFVSRQIRDRDASASASTARPQATSSASAPTTFTPKSDCRPPLTVPSSTPATNRTPPANTAGST